MANNDDYQRDNPDQWPPQQPGEPDQDLSSPAGAPYGLAGQGQMGDAMSRDVDPNLAGQMGQPSRPDITSAQGAPVWPDAPTDQSPIGDLEDAPDEDYP